MRIGEDVKRSCLVVLLLCNCVVMVQAEPTMSKDKVAELSLKLKAVNLQIDGYASRIKAVHSKIIKLQMNASTTNAAISALSREIRYLEGELHKKRQELDKQVKSTPEARELYAKRKLLTLDKQELWDRKVLIENELKAVRLRVAADNAEKSKKNE